jgi:23S rRNA pseudouridine955/2504/2580 synthase
MYFNYVILIIKKMIKQNFIVKEEEELVKITRFLQKKLIKSNFNQISQLLRKGLIKLNDLRIKKDVFLSAGDKIELLYHSLPEKAKKIQPEVKLIESIKEAIIYQDQDIIALNKPEGLATQGGTKIKISLDDLLDHLTFERNNKPKLVHRLDRETSGLILLARHDLAAKNLAEQLRNRAMNKYYLGLCSGRPNQDKGLINIPLFNENSKNQPLTAITQYQVLTTKNNYSLIQFKIETGRKHQIRIHAKSLNRAIVGDKKYGGELAPRLFLHSFQIELYKLQGEKITIIAPLPPSFTNFLVKLDIAVPSKIYL